LSDATPFGVGCVAGAAHLCCPPALLRALRARATLAVDGARMDRPRALARGARRPRTPRQALLAGRRHGVAFELAVFGWFAFAIADYAGTPRAVLRCLGLARRRSCSRSS
jgi:hypothetical protein